MLETSIIPVGISQLGSEPVRPEIKIIEADATHGVFAIEPLERGYGITIGNPIRRTLLSSIEGAAITWVKIDGILHEYTSIPHLKEEVMEFLINVKGIRIRSVTGRAGKMRLEITGEGRICAGDVATSADFEIVNPELHLATLDSDDATFSAEFNVENGKGYQPVARGDGLPGPLMGVLPVDAIFNPVRKVNYSVERTRVGQVTDYERLVLEVWTDGTLTPVEALRSSSEVLVNHFFLFSNVGQEGRAGGDRPSIMVSPEVYQTSIEKLELSPRTLNCLKRAHIGKVGQVLEMSNAELLKIRNFGEKSLQELMLKLHDQGLLSEQEWAIRMESYEAVPEDEDGVALLQEVNDVQDDGDGGDDEEEIRPVSRRPARFEVKDEADLYDDDDDDEPPPDDDDEEEE